MGLTPVDWRPAVEVGARGGLAETASAPAGPAVGGQEQAAPVQIRRRGTMVWVDAVDQTAGQDPHRMRLGTTLRFR